MEPRPVRAGMVLREPHGKFAVEASQAAQSNPAKVQVWRLGLAPVALVVERATPKEKVAPLIVVAVLRAAAAIPV